MPATLVYRVFEVIHSGPRQFPLLPDVHSNPASQLLIPASITAGIGVAWNAKSMTKRLTRAIRKPKNRTVQSCWKRYWTGRTADPEWDGPIEQNEGFDGSGANGSTKTPPVTPPPGGDPPKEKAIVDESGCTVKVIGKTVSVYDANGKLLRQENIIDYTKSNILGDYASLDNFIRKWSAEDKKDKIKDLLCFSPIRNP